MAYIPSSGSVVAFQGTVPFSVLGNIAGSVVSFQGGAPWANTNVGSIISVSQGSVATVIVGGSIAASFTPPANQSVSGTVQADIRGSVATVIIGGSIAASFTPPANQSVSGTVGASLIGLSPVSVSNFPTNQNVSGSVVAFQGTNPWIITGSVQASLAPAANQSVSGTVGASLIGLSPVSVSNFPTNQNVSGSVVSFQGGAWSTSVMVNVITSIATAGQVMGSVAALQATNPWNVAGSVAAFQAGTRTSSLVSTVPSSVLVGASIFGQLPAGTAMIGSIAAYQGSAPWAVAGSVAAFQAGVQATSIQGTVSVLGTVPVTQSGTWNPSALGYATRNDAVASFLGGNLTWNPIATDSAGRLLTKPFASEDGTIISYAGSVVSGSVQLIQASAIGKRTYVTDFWLSNTGATTTLVTFQGGDTSIVGQFIAPTGGGMSSPGISIPLKATLSQDLAFKVSPSTSVLYVTLKGYQAP